MKRHQSSNQPATVDTLEQVWRERERRSDHATRELLDTLEALTRELVQALADCGVSAD